MENLSFSNLNLFEEVLKAIREMGFEEATPIQAQSIPHILKGRDVIGQAQTGTGKTCAFGIPAIEMVEASSNAIQVLVLSPTRELAIQISEELKNLSKYKEGIKILPIYGGQPIERQISALKKKPQIIIGTPGRVMDHMRRKTIRLSNLKMIVLDEADEMLNMGFREDIDTILEKIPKKRQTVLFSATMPKEIMELTKKYQRNPELVKVVHKQITVPSIEQYYLEVGESHKLEVLSRLIDANNIKLCLVFCNTKKRVDEVASSLQSRGYFAEALHGDMKQSERDRVMSKFRKGKIDILIATDVAARGIDVDNIEAVFNYDLPNDEEYYVHRIGRTGRAGRSGKAFTFISGREIYKLKDIQKHTKSTIKPIKPPTPLDIEESKTGILLEKLKEELFKGQFEKYSGYIEKFLNETNSINSEENYITTLDVAAAFMSLLLKQYRTQASSVPEIDEENYHNGSEMIRLFINAGSMDKIRAGNLVQSIASNAGISSKDIGAVDIFDKYTFIEVPKQYVHQVLKSMKNFTLKRRKINIEKSDKKRNYARKMKIKTPRKQN